jgi:hypothetical protein
VKLIIPNPDDPEIIHGFAVFLPIKNRIGTVLDVLTTFKIPLSMRILDQHLT